MFKLWKEKKGVAGLEILLAVVSILFVLGLLVMVFVVTGAEMLDNDISKDTLSGFHNAESLTLVDGGNDTEVAAYTEIALTTVIVTNATSGENISSGNYTVSAGVISSVAGEAYDDVVCNVSYDYSHYGANEAGQTINDTSTAISSVIDWFPIIVVLGAVVVLILMAMLIISAIRGTGMMGGSSGESGRGDYA